MSSMPQINNIVYLMIENRSFDNLLGWLYDNNNLPAGLPVNIPPLKQGEPAFHGLTEPGYTFANSLNGVSYPVQQGVSGDFPCWTPDPDPGETYEHVNNQLFGTTDGSNPPHLQTPTMAGFLQDYRSQTLTDDEALRILNTYTPAELPVLNYLAGAFAVSDMWFASIPSQTDCNRAFAMAGTSLGWVNNYYTDLAYPKPFNTRTIWNVLSDNGKGTAQDWKIYYTDLWLSFSTCFTWQIFPQLQTIPGAANQVQSIDQFYTDLTTGQLPAFSFLEPGWTLEEWGAGKYGNDYHPPGHVVDGEDLIRNLVTACYQSSYWQNMLLVITTDEHGGNYDHIPPSWGATPPDGWRMEAGFNFDRFGVRVPTLLISPWVTPGTVFRSETNVPYDHTSFLATLLNWFGIPQSEWGLGNRILNAPTFENVLTDTANSVTLQIPDNWCSDLVLEANKPMRRQHVLHVATLLAAYHNVPERAAEIVSDIHAKCKTQGDLAVYFKNFELAVT
ncbi:MAG: phospholipase [Blastocatellia bacterium]|nr:phospholipase [Blastocatellia bacterium]